ncbi:DUF397 domain-containing protein [Actinoplanes sp. TFC3]|uniref:DUF397 domain-containing protein n=1 Tax=Actinoplanes sp. TFC3 TaxID=1710355 RepID=UPI000832C51C|nr:DUF397 domain-containing protein [Actinoplanes sp. TFC3]
MEFSNAQWKKSSRSTGDSNCVEVATGLADGAVAVRDTKDREGGTLLFTRGEWEAFLGGAKDGEFDLPN